MKPAQIKAIRSRLAGSVVASADVCRLYATDGGVLSVTPSAMVYPADGADVSATVAYAAEHAGTTGGGLVARGAGTGASGGALGAGTVVALTGLNEVHQLGKDTVTVGAGMMASGLLQLLATHRRTVPGLAQHGRATLGGALAGGVDAQLADQIVRLKVVLDDGSEVTTGRLSRRELNRKKGLMTREGDVYRGLDGLLEDHQAQIDELAGGLPEAVTPGYQLARVGRGGGLDLGQLLVGSEGTLGIITEVTLKTAPLPDRTTVVAGTFETLDAAAEAIHKLARQAPTQLQLVNQAVLEEMERSDPERFKSLLGVDATAPAALVWARFDDASHWQQNRQRRRAQRAMGKHGAVVRSTHEPREQSALTDLVAKVMISRWGQSGAKKPLPLLNGAAVPPAQLATGIEQTAKLLSKHQADDSVWADGLTGRLYAAPSFDLSKPKSRKAALKLLDELAGLVGGLGGYLNPGGEGLIGAPYLENRVGAELFDLFRQVKQLCDPKGVFHGEPKLATKKKDLDTWLRHEYAPSHPDALGGR